MCAASGILIRMCGTFARLERAFVSDDRIHGACCAQRQQELAALKQRQAELRARPPPVSAGAVDPRVDGALPLALVEGWALASVGVAAGTVKVRGLFPAVRVCRGFRM
jgi:hypothetical protein